MKVCYLINQLAPGGAPRLLLDIVQYASDTYEIDITVCYVEGDDTLASAFESAGARVVSFDAAFKFEPRAMYRMVRFFRAHEFDIVHAHLPYSQILARLSSLVSDSSTIISTQHDFPRRYHPITRTLERATRPIDDATIAVSDAVKASFLDQFGGDFPTNHRWKRIYNGVDVRSFSESVEQANETEVRSRLGIPETATVILNVGRFAQPKAQSDLVLAMETVHSECSAAHLVLVGWGPLRDELESLVAEKGLSECVTIIGPVDPVEPYYAIGDVFALSSISESFGIVLVEAMAARLPVVSTAIPGSREVVSDGETGVLVPPSKPSVLADSIIDVIDSGDPFGEQGFNRAISKFDIEKITESHMELYTDFL